jgi:hypothetical protein
MKELTHSGSPEAYSAWRRKRSSSSWSSSRSPSVDPPSSSPWRTSQSDLISVKVPRFFFGPTQSDWSMEFRFDFPTWCLNRRLFCRVYFFRHIFALYPFFNTLFCSGWVYLRIVIHFESKLLKAGLAKASEKLHGSSLDFSHSAVSMMSRHRFSRGAFRAFIFIFVLGSPRRGWVPNSLACSAWATGKF